MSRIGIIQYVIAEAITDRLEGDFDVELKKWERRSGFDMMGTESIEAEALADIAKKCIKDLTEAEIASRLAEMTQ